MNTVKFRIVTLLAIPLVAFALLVAGTGPASASDRTVVFHSTRYLHIPAPASTNGADAAATADGENCVWDVWVYRYDSTGRISGRLAVSCDGPMAQIAFQIVLLNNGNPRGDASYRDTRYNRQNIDEVLPRPVACLSGVNYAYGAVSVMDYAGRVASDFGYSANYITC
jgi:hypothetical protein